MGPQAIPAGTGELILGRGNQTLWGLQLHPEVRDEDYTEKIKVLTQLPQLGLILYMN